MRCRLSLLCVPTAELGDVFIYVLMLLCEEGVWRGGEAAKEGLYSERDGVQGPEAGRGVARRNVAASEGDVATRRLTYSNRPLILSAAIASLALSVACSSSSSSSSVVLVTRG